MAQKPFDLCLATDVAADLGVPSDARVERAVSAASRAIARWCGRTFELAEDIVEYPPGFGRPLLTLERPPIVSIDSISEQGAEVDVGDYESAGVNAEAGLVLHKSRGWLNTQRLEPRSISETYAGAHGQSDLIVVTYTGGYVTPGQNLLDPGTYPTVTLPEDVIDAAAMTACAWYRSKGLDPNIASESIGDWSISYFDSRTDEGNAVPAPARGLLAPYRRGWAL